MSVSVCLSVTEVHCGHGACREEGTGHLALCYPLLGPLVLYFVTNWGQNAPDQQSVQVDN